MLGARDNVSWRARYGRNHKVRIMKHCHEAWIATVE